MRIYPIRTERLVLRYPEMRDAPVLVKLLGDPSVSRNIPRINYPYRRADALKWLRRVRKPRFNASFGRGYDFMIEVDGEVVGCCHLSWNLKERRAFFGYWVGRPYRGQGIATEAALGLVDFAFGKLGAERVWAMAFADNLASRRVLAKAGLKEEVLMRRNAFFRGQWRDDVGLGVLRSEWAQRLARSRRRQ
ncbi:MAG TPA: GNAT family protein [Candidatus Thermoplasmatota archaeon]|nr:GNAT family protein [Candidatus Thermoplasmatota archaeon]